MQKIDNYTFLTSAPVDKVVLTMAVPTIISMLITSLYNIADTFCRKTKYTGNSFSRNRVFCNVLHSGFWILFWSWFCNYISHELGAKRHKNAQKWQVPPSFFYGVRFVVYYCWRDYAFKPLSIFLEKMVL